MQEMQRETMTAAESAANDRAYTAMRLRMEDVVTSVRHHKDTGCTEAMCPGTEVVSFFQDIRTDPDSPAAAHWLYVAIMVAAGEREGTATLEAMADG